MEIIKKGDIPKYRLKCRYCNTEFEFTKEDTTRKNVLNFSWLQYTKLKISCPLCNSDYLFDRLEDIKHLMVNEITGGEK